MEIEVRLKRILADYGLDSRGVMNEIAKDTGLNRHTVSKIYKNENVTPLLDSLGQISDWLVAHKVPLRQLPGALFGARPNKLWEAATASGLVTIYMGEYQQSLAQTHMSWISKRDAAVCNEIVRWLSTPGFCGTSPPRLWFEYLPFRVDVSAKHITQKELKRDRSAAVQKYRKMRAELADSSAVLIGSQRINKLVEMLVADLFGCEPFKAESEVVRVPFYLAYRTQLRPVASCFGGLTNPPGVTGKFMRGMHYLDKMGQWKVFPWIDGKQDSGIVVTEEAGTKGMLLAVFGLSGRASEALGRYLTKSAAPFWPPRAVTGSPKIRVYVCNITYNREVSDEPVEPDDKDDIDVDVVEMDHEILTKYLKPG